MGEHRRLVRELGEAVDERTFLALAALRLAEELLPGALGRSDYGLLEGRLAALRIELGAQCPRCWDCHRCDERMEL